MFVSDLPIASKEQDKLGRAAFSESLGKAIIDYREEDSLVIGLYGTWGSGKTSIINMAVESIEGSQAERCSVILRFNPWNYSDQNQLIAQFFKELAGVLPNQKGNEGFHRAAKLLDLYAACITPLTYIPNPKAPLAVIQKKTCQWLANILRKLAKDKSLEGLKSELNGVLQKQKIKIVVVIDDIDRLNNTEIRQIFQLVKSLADFKNTVYVLAFDKDVVVNALAKVQEGDGHEYLEKVVQVPFAVPDVSISEVHRFLFSSLNQIIGDLPKERWDSRYWAKIFFSGIRIFYKTIRDVNRFINVFKFKYFLLKEDVNVIDLTAITAVQVFLPDLYVKIRDNKKMFVEGHRDRGYGRDMRQQLSDAFDTIINENVRECPKEEVKELLKEVFPQIQSFCGNMTYGDGFEPEWRRRGRVCSDDNFDLYFQLGLSSGQISKSKIEHIIDESEHQEIFCAEVKKLRDESRLSIFLKRLLDYSGEMPIERTKVIISVLIDLGDSFPDDDEGFYSFDNYARVGRVNHWLLKDVKDQGKCYEIIKRAIETASNSIYTVVDAVVWLGWEHGKGTQDGPNPEDEQKVSKEQLAELEKLACQKIEEWASNGRLIKHRRLLGILYMWERWAGEHTVRQYVENSIEKDEGLIAFIENIPSKSKSQGMGDYTYKIEYQVNMQTVSHFMELEEIIPRLREISSSSNFESLTEEQRRAIRLVLDTHDGKIKSSF